LTGSRELAFVGDVHLDRDDRDLAPFLLALDGLGERAGRIILMGDLFNLWIGERRLELPHQAAVADRLASLRRRGVEVVYVEGNRDYGIAEGYLGTAFDRVTGGGAEERWGGRRLFAVHGDLANVADRQYRAWRRLSRSGPFLALFRLVPSGARLRLAERLEARMRSTNLRMKRVFPEARVREYAAPHLARGIDAVVLGHFHEERRLSAPPAPGEIVVLPDWKSSRRYFRVTGEGRMEFAPTP
jgi:UDP-2,3-diacylglucosamine hydrolase